MNHLELHTKRFTLKVLTPELVSEEYRSWFEDNEASKFIDYAKQIVTLSELKKYAQEKFESTEALFFGIFINEDQKHIGNIKFEPINFREKYAILGILIGDNDWRGKGVFSEIDEALIPVLKKIGITKIYLGVSSDNSAAVKAYIKSGFEIDKNDFLKVEVKKSHTMIKVIS